MPKVSLSIIDTDDDNPIRYRLCSDKGKTKDYVYTFTCKSNKNSNIKLKPYVKDFKVNTSFLIQGQYIYSGIKTPIELTGKYFATLIEADKNTTLKTVNGDIVAKSIVNPKLYEDLKEVEKCIFNLEYINDNNTIVSTDVYTDDMKIYTRYYAVVVGQSYGNPKTGDYGVIVKITNEDKEYKDIVVVEDPSTQITRN